MRSILQGSMTPMALRKGGGGGGSSTSTSGIDPEFKPYLERVLSDVTDRYEGEVAAGADAIVADLSPEQLEAQARQKALGREMAGGYGDLIEGDLRALQGQQMAQGQGTLGSARADRARQAGLADRALSLRQADDQRRQAGISSIGQVGAELQEQKQRKLDAPHTSAQRYFGYLGNAPQQTTTTQSGGGK